MSGISGKIEWYLARDGQQHGPLSQRELDKFIELGHLRPADLLWRAGFDDWRSAASVFPPQDTASKPETQELREPAIETTPEPKPSEEKSQTAARSGQEPQSRAVEPERPRSIQERMARVDIGEPRQATQPNQSPEPQRGADRHPGPGSPADLHAGNSGERPTWDHGRDPAVQQSVVADAHSAKTQRREHDNQLQPHAARTDVVSQPHRPQATAATAAATSAATGSLDDDAFLDDDDEPGRSGWLMVAAALFLLVIAGAGGLFAYNNQTAIASLYSDLAKPKQSRDVAVVKAPKTSPREPVEKTEPRSKITASLNQTTPSETPAVSQPVVQPVNPATAEKPELEIPLLKSKLWQYAQREFGEWTEKRLAYVRHLVEQDKTKEEANKYLIESFVRFRRENAPVALLASADSLEQVANTFVASLKALTARGAQACYAFISNGESTPEVAPLYFEPDVGQKLEAQMLAILKAIANGRTVSTNNRQPPTADDFNKLSAELVKRGWTPGDLRLFSDPNELSKAKPEVVCRLVTEWFATQTKLVDKATRDQLIAASLRPVIGG